MRGTQTRRKAGRAAVSLCAVLLAGCGTADKQLTGPPPDTTAPTITDTTPTSGASGVPVYGHVTATFSEVMDPTTVTASTFSVATGGGSTILATVTYSQYTATLTPSANLAAGSNYVATVAAGVRDAAGNYMAAPRSWAFTTGSGGGTAIVRDPPTIRGARR